MSCGRASGKLQLSEAAVGALQDRFSTCGSCDVRKACAAALGKAAETLVKARLPDVAVGDKVGNAMDSWDGLHLEVSKSSQNSEKLQLPEKSLGAVRDVESYKRAWLQCAILLLLMHRALAHADAVHFRMLRLRLCLHCSCEDSQGQDAQVE